MPEKLISLVFLWQDPAWGINSPILAPRNLLINGAKRGGDI
jgi:hypothetical protein